MEIDKDSLIKLLAAFMDASEILHRESMLYQLLFTAACKTKGLSEAQTDEAVAQGRLAMAEKISAACRADYQSLLEKLPQIVDLLVSHPRVMSPLQTTPMTALAVMLTFKGRPGLTSICTTPTI